MQKRREMHDSQLFATSYYSTIFVSRPPFWDVVWCVRPGLFGQKSATFGYSSQTLFFFFLGLCSLMLWRYV